MKLRTLNSRRGFALVAVLMILVLLLTFLMAAQGSVMQGRLHIKRSADRFDGVEKSNSAVVDMRDRLRREIAARQVGDAWEYGTGESILLLRSDDPIYGELPMISHRAGDALLTRVEMVDSVERKTQFLINGTGQRSGSIRIR